MNADDPLNPPPADARPAAGDTPGAEAKPARRRRAPQVKPETTADGPPPAAPESAAEPAERAPANVAAADAGSEAPAVEGTGAAVADADPAAPRGRRNRRRGRNRSRGSRDGDGVPASALDVVDAAGGPESGDDDDDDDEAAEGVPPLPPVDVGALFADVQSGAFDAEPTPGEADEIDEAVQTKRVLAADADAPKLHKVLAQSGIGSRRDMEQWIADGRITVNGEAAHVGQRVNRHDRVVVGGRPVKLRIAPPAPRIVAYHKPVGEIVTHDDPQQRPTVFRKLPRLPQGRWLSVGRLDVNTEGLLLFTNSGDLANQLMHPRFGVEREYAVRVLGTLDDDSREELLEGVFIDGQRASFKSIEDGGGDGANRWYRVVISEGRNREVRRLFEEIGLTVSRLIRIRYGNVVLPRGLKRGVWVALGDADVAAICQLAAGDGARGGQPGRDGRGDNKRGGKRGRGGNDRRPPDAQVPAGARAGERDDHDEHDDDHGPIPNPLQQTFDRRFVQGGPRGGGFGQGGRGGNKGRGGGQQGGDGPKQPDPMQTSVGYIGGDAFFRKIAGGGRRGGGGGGGGGRGRR